MEAPKGATEWRDVLNKYDIIIRVNHERTKEREIIITGYPCSGIEDIKGKKIFANDIVKYHNGLETCKGRVAYVMCGFYITTGYAYYSLYDARYTVEIIG